MLNKAYQMVFFSTLIMGTILACSASTWYTSWLGLEINLMSLIPLLIIKLTPLSTETAIKYFMVQAMASMMLIFTSLLESMSTVSMLEMSSIMIIFIALSVKMGMAPFHFWFPQVMKISNWAQCSIILTWQKIAPFVLISSMFNKMILIVVVLMSTLVGSIGGLNQLTMKNILTYSSIMHSAWMLSVCCVSLSTWAVYFLMYSLMSLTLIFLLYKLSMNNLLEIYTLKTNKLNKTALMFTIMSLGGLPPFLGFMIKLMAAQTIISEMGMLVPLILISGSLISLYYYVRVMYTLLVMTSQSMMIQSKTHIQPSAVLLSVVVMGNIMAPFLVSLV